MNLGSEFQRFKIEALIDLKTYEGEYVFKLLFERFVRVFVDIFHGGDHLLKGVGGGMVTPRPELTNQDPHMHPRFKQK